MKNPCVISDALGECFIFTKNTLIVLSLTNHCLIIFFQFVMTNTDTVLVNQSQSTMV